MINMRWEAIEAAQCTTDWGEVIVNVAGLALIGFFLWLFFR